MEYWNFSPDLRVFEKERFYLDIFPKHKAGYKPAVNKKTII